MKLNLTVLILWAAIACTSCNRRTSARLENTSPNQKVHTVITATRASAVDPWIVVLNVKAYDFQKGDLKFEIYADELNDQSVKFNWKDDQTCLITFTERDDKKVFQLLVNARQLQLGQI
jgi:hypothetical protein